MHRAGFMPAPASIRRGPKKRSRVAIDWLRRQGSDFSAVGIASFGPLDLDPASSGWGHITRTTKPHWSDADVAGPFGRAFDCPVAIDTDVNGAALAEWLWGAGQGTNASLYLTVGTGIGGGAVVGGRLIHGVGHPEMGHIRMPRHPDDGDFAGICPFHGDCLEGLASGPAIKARWGASLSELPSGHRRTPDHRLVSGAGGSDFSGDPRARADHSRRRRDGCARAARSRSQRSGRPHRAAVSRATPKRLSWRRRWAMTPVSSAPSH